MNNSATRYISRLSVLLVFLGVVFFVLPQSVSAATYYVATTGNDTTGDGSEGNPWLTLQKAETAATNGDTVNVSVGTYVEDDATTHGWNVSKAITWIANGEVIVKGTAPTTRPLYISGTGATSITGFTIDSEGLYSYTTFFANGTSNKTLTDLTFQGSTAAAINVAGNNNTITNSTFTINAGDAIRMTGFDVINIDSNTFTLNGNSKLLTTTGAGGTVSFSNNTISGTTISDLIGLSHNGNYTISDNDITFTGNTYSVISSGNAVGSISLLRNNVIFPGKTTIEPFKMISGTWNIDIDGNDIYSEALDQAQEIIYIRDQVSPEVHNNIIETFSTLASEHVFITSTGIDGGSPLVKDNTLKNHSSVGHIIYIGTETSGAGNDKLNGAIIEGNTVYGALYFDSSATNVSNHSIFVGHNLNAIIRYNTVYGGGYGIVLKHVGSTQTSGGVYYNKLINSTGASSIRIKGVKDVEVTNNTIYIDSSFSSSYYLLDISVNGAGESSTGTKIKNNIFWGGSSQPLFLIDSDSVTNIISDYNVLYRHNVGDIANYAGSTKTLSEWRTMGYDANGVDTDPQFTNVDGNDFSLLVTSPVVDVGTTITGLTMDILSNNIYGTPDIGAYEYQPPYTVGTNESDIDGDVRVYADGKFRNTQTPSGTTADLSVTPVGGFGAGDYSEWMNIVISTWNTAGDYAKSWTESSDSIGSDSTVHTVGDLEVGGQYILSVNDSQGLNITSDDCTDGICTADESGEIAFTYTGGYSTVSFDISEYVEPTPTPTPTPIVSTSSNTSSSSISSPSAPSCGDQSPGAKAPWLYSAVAQNGNSILLYFTEADDPVDHYTLEFGNKAGEYPWGSTNIGGKGTRTYLVQSLSPNTTYYFRIRGGNGCATGGWSNEISATTKGLIAFKQLAFEPSELEAVASAPEQTEEPTADTCQTYTVKSGDSLWGIAQSELGDGNKYRDIITQNQDTYPSLATSNSVSAGWELKLDCEAFQAKTSDEKQASETETLGGYAVNVKVTDKNQKPVEGAKVTIHSKVQEAATNANGIARFENVEPGEHRVLIAYNNYEGEQSVNLTGDVKEFNLNVTIQQKNVLTSPLVLAIMGGMGLVIVVLLFLLRAKSRKS